MLPYAKEYKYRIPTDTRTLIVNRLNVQKLPRKELEDKFFETYDENFLIKKENKESLEKIKQLVTKLNRLSTINSKNTKTNDDVRGQIKRLEEQNIILMEKLNSITVKYKINPKSFGLHRLLPNKNYFDKDLHSRTESVPAIHINSEQRNGSEVNSFSNSWIKSPNSDPEPLNGHDDIVSPQISETSSLGQAEHIDSQTLDNQIRSLQENLSKLSSEKEELVKMKSELLIENSTLKEKLSATELNTKLTETSKIHNLQKIVREGRSKMRSLSASKCNIQAQSSMALQRKEARIAELENHRQSDTEQIFQLKQQVQCSEENRKLIEHLQKQLHDLSMERDLLLNEKESSQIMALNSIQSTNFLTPRENCTHPDIEQLQKSLGGEKLVNEVLINSQQQLVGKVQSLQNENDQLLIDLEGKRKELNMVYQNNVQIKGMVNR